MKLGRKTLLYSLGLSILVFALTAGYMIFMLPSLYLDNKIKSHRNKMRANHERLLEDKSYENISDEGSLNLVSVFLPSSGYEIKAFSRAISVAIDVKDVKLREIVDDIRSVIESSGSDQADFDANNDKLRHIVKSLESVIKEMYGSQEKMKNYFSIDVRKNDEKAESYIADTGDINVIPLDSHSVMVESSIADNNTRYISTVIFTRHTDGFYVSLMPSVMVEMNDLMDTILGSLPMILAVLAALAVAVSAAFSNGIIQPIIKMANYTKGFDPADDNSDELPDMGRRDEIGELSVSINEFCDNQRKSYLAIKNESQQKEVLLKAAAHQLKTPLAAGLLLTDGMIAGIGKYQDKDKYLPQLKAQLKYLQKMIEDILVLNRKANEPVTETIDASELCQRILDKLSVSIREKDLNVSISGSGSVAADPDMFYKIIDNLFINAVNYTENKGKIDIAINNNQIKIYNEPAHIRDELVDCIKEPFVSGCEARSTGLGLYLADYYAKILGFELKIENHKQGVTAALIHDKEK